MCRISIRGASVLPDPPARESKGSVRNYLRNYLAHVGVIALVLGAFLIPPTAVLAAQPRAETGGILEQELHGDGASKSLNPDPGVVTPASPYPSSVVTVEPVPGVRISFLGASGGITTAQVRRLSKVPPPAAVQLGSDTKYFRIATTSDFFSAMVCVPYGADLADGEGTTISLLYLDSKAGWEPATLAMPDNPNPVTRKICGQASSLSTFLVGIVPVDFLFRNLLEDIRTLPSATTSKGMRHRLRLDARAAHAAFLRGERENAGERVRQLKEDIFEQAEGDIGAADADRLLNKVTIIRNLLTRRE